MLGQPWGGEVVAGSLGGGDACCNCPWAKTPGKTCSCPNLEKAQLGSQEGQVSEDGTVADGVLNDEDTANLAAVGAEEVEELDGEEREPIDPFFSDDASMMVDIDTDDFEDEQQDESEVDLDSPDAFLQMLGRRQNPAKNAAGSTQSASSKNWSPKKTFWDARGKKLAKDSKWWGTSLKCNWNDAYMATRTARWVDGKNWRKKYEKVRIIGSLRQL